MFIVHCQKLFFICTRVHLKSLSFHVVYPLPFFIFFNSHAKSLRQYRKDVYKHFLLIWAFIPHYLFLRRGSSFDWKFGSISHWGPICDSMSTGWEPILVANKYLFVSTIMIQKNIKNRTGHRQTNWSLHHCLIIFQFHFSVSVWIIFFPSAKSFIFKMRLACAYYLYLAKKKKTM